MTGRLVGTIYTAHDTKKLRCRRQSVFFSTRYALICHREETTSLVREECIDTDDTGTMKYHHFSSGASRSTAICVVLLTYVNAWICRCLGAIVWQSMDSVVSVRVVR